MRGTTKTNKMNITSNKSNATTLGKAASSIQPIETRNAVIRHQAFDPKAIPSTSGVLVTRQGAIFTRPDGTQASAGRTIVATPTVKQLKAMDAYKGKTDEELDQVRVDIGTKAKPEAMALISAAGSDQSFILRQLAMRKGKKSNLTVIGLVLEQVKVADKLHELMTATGKSEFECREFLGMDPTIVKA
jgi:hypothetical protein